MLFLRKRAERLARESKVAHDAQIEAVRIGVVAALNPKFNAAWQRSRHAASSAPAQTVDGYRATVARLGALQGRRGPLGLVN